VYTGYTFYLLLASIISTHALYIYLCSIYHMYVVLHSCMYRAHTDRHTARQLGIHDIDIHHTDIHHVHIHVVAHVRLKLYYECVYHIHTYYKCHVCVCVCTHTYLLKLVVWYRGSTVHTVHTVHTRSELKKKKSV
jgi:hypothetical protein